jgi:nanoRNase/pAp phosphatase (c-di-AMP/oligoRNAs hydrolase)
MYLVIGCDDFGFQIAEALKARTIETVVVDENPGRIEHLKSLGYRENETVLGNPTSPAVLEKAGLDRADAVFIMLPDHSAIEEVLQTINSLKVKLRADPVVLVLVRVPEQANAAEVKELGASDVLPVNQLFAAAAVSRFEELKLMVNEKRLRRLRENERTKRGKLAIILQTNPDPDSIASGLALKLYARTFGVDADIIYDGEFGRPQNRALVNYLNLEMFDARNVKFENYKWFALVDVATHANCSLPSNLTPSIVIDHHTVPSSEVQAVFQEITQVAAASTLLTNYLKFANVEMDRPTATALILGIVTDTLNFIRGLTPLDMQAYGYLFELADKDMLGKLFSPAIPSEDFNIYAKVVKASKIKGSYLFANIGEVRERDTIAFAADFLLQREGVSTTFVYGTVGNDIFVSARTKDVALHLGNKLREAFPGMAGGHAKMAGATIPISTLKPADNLKSKMDRVLKTRFLEVVGVLKPRKQKKPRKK